MSDFQKRLQHLASITKNPSTVISMLLDHDDRTTAIMMGGFLEDLIALGIMAKFKQSPTENQLTELFTGYGPLSSLASRVALGHLLGIIGVSARHDLNIIRKIRNEFAHVVEPISFQSEGIASRCKSLKLKAELEPSPAKKIGAGPRSDFIRSGLQVLVMILLHGQLAIEETHLIKSNETQLKKTAREKLQKGMKGKMPAAFS